MAISTTHRLRPIFLLLAALWLVSSTMAQTVTTSIADGTTPPSIQAGAPEGSYALSGFETVNIFNGNLDVRLPLYKVGGRGTAGYTIYLPIEQRWIVQHRETPTTQTDVPMATDSISGSMFGHAWFLRYSPGTLVGRYVRDVSGDTPCPAPNSSISALNTVLTRITWIEGDGTEHELRDQITGGQPVVSTAGQSACSSSPPLGTARGSAFTSADGTSLTFIADSPPIYDPVRTLDLGSGTFSPSGWLLFPNGNRFRISNGRVTTIEDRNGNITTLNFTSAGGTVTDPLAV